MTANNRALSPTVYSLGVDGYLVSFSNELSEPANRAALALRDALESESWAGVEETSTSLVSTYLRFDLAATDHAAVRARLDALLASRDWSRSTLAGGRRIWHVPAVFGTDLAPQLPDAAALAGLSTEQAIQSICARPLRIQTIGFAPGQPYLGQLSSEWDIPRQTELTPQVPEGALVVAIRQMVLFSVSTPTGWRHVGQTRLRLFRPETEQPFIFRPGDEVQFSSISPEEFHNIGASDPDGGARSEVLR